MLSQPVSWFEIRYANKKICKRDIRSEANQIIRNKNITDSSMLNVQFDLSFCRTFLKVTILSVYTSLSLKDSLFVSSVFNLKINSAIYLQ